MAKLKALWNLIKVVGKYGAKVLKYLKSAFDVIWKYGTKAVNWVINNIGKIVSYICFLLFSRANLYMSICCLLFEIIFIVVLSWNCSYNVIQFSKIENYNIGFKIKGWIAYIENIILIQAPLILGYWIISTYDYSSMGLIRYLIVMCCTICIIMISIFTIKRRSRRIYKNVVEFL